MKKRKVLGFIKLLVAVSPLFWVASRIDAVQLEAALHKISWWTVPAVTLIALGAVFLQVLRWWILMVSFDPSLPFGKALSAHFRGLFYSIVLPTGVAHEALRMAFISKHIDYRIVWSASWLCKLFGILALTLLSLFGLFSLERLSLPPWFPLVLPALFLVAVVFVFMSFSKTVTRRLRPLTSLLLPQKVEQKIAEIRQGVYLYREKRGPVLLTAAISFCIQLVSIVNSCLLIKGVAGIFPLAECLAFFPAIVISTMLFPLAPNGVGTREALYALFFKYLELPHVELGLFVLLNLCVILIVKSLGGLPVLLAGRKNERVGITGSRPLS